MAKHSARKVRRFYQFIELHQEQYAVKTMCRLLNVTRSGYYAWLNEPISNRAQEDARLLRLIRASFLASHGIYGAPRVFLDLREAGETCSKHRVARLMRINGIRAKYGYGARRHSPTKISALTPNSLQRNFTVSKPNRAWVTDITYIANRLFKALFSLVGTVSPVLRAVNRALTGENSPLAVTIQARHRPESAFTSRVLTPSRERGPSKPVGSGAQPLLCLWIRLCA